MADKFELLPPGNACAAALPVNIIKDDYSITRLVTLVRTSDDGGTQPMVLPRRVVHPEANKVVTERLSGRALEGVSGGRALLPKWGAAPNLSSPDAQAVAKLDIDPAVVHSLLPDYEFALYFPYVQAWELLGYSRGALLNSVSLAPQEETTIEIFSWERMKRTREETVDVEQESTQETTLTDKDSREVLKELTKDSSFTFHAGLNVQVPSVPVGIDVGADTKDSLRDVSRATQQTVNEAVSKASVRMKTSRQTKVTESEEFGRETRVTRKLRNPNMCRTLSIDMFEILSNYSVSTALLHERVVLCVLVPIPINMEVSREFLLVHEGVLRRTLLSPVYASGFVAARLLATWQHLCEVKCVSPCACEPVGVPPSGNPAVDAARQQVADAAAAVAASITAVNAAMPDDLCDLACLRRSGTESEWAAAKMLYHQWLYAKLMDLIAPRWWATCRTFSQSTDRSPEAADRFLQAANVQPADIFNLVLLGIRFYAKAAEIAGTLVSLGCWNVWVLITNIAFNDAGLDGAINQLRSAVAAYRAAVEAARQPPPAPGQQPVTPGPPPEFPPQDLARALVDEAALIAHISGNAAYYRFVIWEALAPNDRATLLAGQGNLMTFLDPEVLGYVGTKIAFPFRLKSDPDVTKWFQDNVLNNAGLKEPPQPFTVVLQTPGVMAESRLGQCDACEEFITNHRELDLQQKMAEVVITQQRAEQEKSEAQRYQMRLSQKQPILEDPDTNREGSAIRVILQQDKPITPTEPPKT